MGRKPRQDAEAIGSDSFLDVVTNIVGILIILVMVVGIRVKNTAPSELIDEEGMKREVAQLTDEAESLERDVQRLEGLVHQVTFSSQAKFQERATMAYVLAESERELEKTKKSLDAEKQSSFDMRRDVAAAQAELKKLADAKSEAAKPKKRVPVQIKSYPTPISKTVFGQEIHFQLKHGRLAMAPLEEIGRIGAQAAAGRIQLLETHDYYSGVVGPQQGFEGHYEVERVEMDEGRVRGSYSIDLVPISDNLGETVDEALRPNSRFRAQLGDFAPRQSTVTLWTYGDSFNDYARVKEVLYGLGYHVAARPLTDDMYIGGSDHGTHSAAQ
ncbi:MAG TPA: hypothetical protein VHC22_04405 [Pirellulales bacterium]|nr:hypothetical protein [Pirellulales bacterium]